MCPIVVPKVVPTRERFAATGNLAEVFFLVAVYTFDVSTEMLWPHKLLIASLAMFTRYLGKGTYIVPCLVLSVGVDLHLPLGDLDQRRLLPSASLPGGASISASAVIEFILFILGVTALRVTSVTTVCVLWVG